MFTSWGSWHVHKGEQTTEGDLGRHISTHSARALMLKRDEEQPRWGTQQTQRADILGTVITLLVTTILQQCQRLSNGALVYQIWLFGYNIGANDCCMWNAVCSKATTTHSNKAHMLTYNLCIAWGSQQPNHLCALSTSHKVTKSIHHSLYTMYSLVREREQWRDTVQNGYISRGD
jgi:hypothetical protein